MSIDLAPDAMITGRCEIVRSIAWLRPDLRDDRDPARCSRVHLAERGRHDGCRRLAGRERGGDDRDEPATLRRTP